MAKVKKKKSRAETAGESLGLVVVEMAQLMYQNNTKRNFYRGLMDVLNSVKKA